MSFGTRIWDLEGQGASDSDCAPALLANKPAVPKDSQSNNAQVGGNVSAAGTWQRVLSWTTEKIGIIDWPSGTYTASFRIARVPSGTFAARIYLAQVSSSCVSQGDVFASSFGTTVGTYSFDFVLNPPSGLASHRLQCGLEVFYPSGAAQLFSVNVNHADTFLRAPLLAGQSFLHSHNQQQSYLPLLVR